MPTFARKFELYLVVSTDGKVNRSEAIRTVDSHLINVLQKHLVSFGNKCKLEAHEQMVFNKFNSFEWKLYSPEEFLNPLKDSTKVGKK